MMRKIFCCGKKSREEDEYNHQKMGGDALEVLAEQQKEEAVQRMTKILREDLYQNYMKPYFKLG